MSLAELSARQPVLTIFLRHSGCTFCRETLAELAVKRRYIESQGVTLAIVHMSPPLEATQLLQRYDLDDIHRFGDPRCQLYEAFGLPRGDFNQLFNWHILRRGVGAGFVQGHGLGPLSGDGFRLSGAFLLDNGRVIAARRSKTAADRLDLLELLAEVSESCSTSFRRRPVQAAG